MNDYLESEDWFGQSSPYKPRMRYRIEGQVFHFEFRADKSPVCDFALKRGEFVAGLWEQDVAEFFVSAGGAQYQEINISPTGAWWSALFSGYRQEERELRFSPLIQSHVTAEAWQVEFQVELSSLLPWQDLEPSQCLISPTCILYDPEPSYFAWNHNSGGEPDFHQASLFRSLR